VTHIFPETPNVSPLSDRSLKGLRPDLLQPPRRFPENASSQSVRTSCRAARNDQRTAPRGWETVKVPVGPPPHRAMARRPYLSIDGPPVDFPKIDPHKVSEHRAEPRGMTNGPRHGAGKL
jgi:hypothetical protein